MKSDHWVFIAFLGGAGFLLLFNLWGRSIENHDYLRYAEVAREMIRSGDWIVPRFNGEIFIHKPPLLFWLIALPSNLYGAVTPFIARLPSAFFAWIGALVVYLWGRKIYGENRCGLISAGVLMSSYMYFWQGRIARTDMVFSVLILLSLYFFYLNYEKERRYLFIGLSFTSIGLAGLTKGPVGILFPLLIIFLFLLKQKQLKYFIQKEFVLGYFIVVLISGTWVIPFLLKVGLDSALKGWQETRILSRHAPFYLYGYRIWIDFVPWSFFLPFLIFYYWKKEKSRDEELLILWFIALFVLLTFFPIRSSKYLLPAFPPLALLMGGFWRKRSLPLFGVIFFSAMMAWHGYEYSLIQKNEINSPGFVLHRELKIYQDKDIMGYRMDMDVLGKINFYGDRVIPQMNKVGDLKEKAKGKEEIFIISTERGLQDFLKEGFLVTSTKKIDYGKGSILLFRLQRL